GVPLLLGITEAMRSLRSLFTRQEFWTRAEPWRPAAGGMPNDPESALPGDFMRLRGALTAAGVAVVETRYVRSEREAVAAARELGMPVAIKAEAPDLLHKSDIGCVRLGCATDEAVTDAYRTVVDNAAKAGFANAGALIQPMIAGVAEAYAGVVGD